MLKTMSSFSVSGRPDLIKALDLLAKKYNSPRSRIARAILLVALKDETIMQRAKDLLQ